jgi:hypothetical protein
MTLKEAKSIIGSSTKWSTKNMKQALAMHPWLNTPDDWQRLQAAYIVTRTPHAKRLPIPTTNEKDQDHDAS